MELRQEARIFLAHSAGEAAFRRSSPDGLHDTSRQKIHIGMCLRSTLLLVISLKIKYQEEITLVLLDVGKYLQIDAKS